jgi:formimidoylglutamate deiminase
MTVLVPELVLGPDGRTREHAAVELDGDRIARILDAADAPADAVRLPRRLLVPGLVNAHSHAFQRALRGRVERVDPAHPHDDFWTWREEMYAAATALDPDSVRRASEACFREARAAGYTTVGEFHYIHHQPDGTPYDEPNELAHAVCAAARAAGIRLVLLQTASARAGRGLPPSAGQRRFCDASVDRYLARVDALREHVAGEPLITVGYAPHSVRALPRDWLEAIGQHASESGLPVHVHADEQPREIEESLAEHGLRPISLLDACGLLGPRTTIIHATHADDAELDLMAARGASVCACPSTEANLGDGFLPAARLWERGVPVAVGSDSNTRLDPFEEARETEGLARRQAGRRNVLVRQGEDGPARSLWECLTVNGARALGLPAAELRADAPADLVALDLDHAEIADVPSEHLPAAVLFSGSSALVRETWVAGSTAGAAR